MNLILFAFVLILFNLSAPGSAEGSMVDALPDFIGYLILWFTLEKRKINGRMRGVYSVTAVMIPLSFLLFLSQIQGMFLPSMIEDERNTGWVLLHMVLSVFSFVDIKFNGLILLLGSLVAAGFFFAMLNHWEQKQEDRKQRLLCKSGIGLCLFICAVYLVTAFLPNLPLAPQWITYPLSAGAIVLIWYSMKDVSEMETGTKS